MHRATVLAVSVALTATCLPAFASAQDTTSERYASRAVQQRRYFRNHQITAYGGVLPLDAFEKGITVGGSYTLHFDELVAWEIIHFAYSFPVGTDLRDQLESLGLMETPFEIVEWYGTTNLVLTPIYWKAAVTDTSLLHGEFFFLLGGGFGRLTRTSRAVVDLGLGTRFFFNETFSLVLDFRYMFLFTDEFFQSGNGLRDELWIGLGLAVAL
ncbi:MAG: outer membrane beta-barrel domain-containing protein [Sandaracinaceae bacterium]